MDEVVTEVAFAVKTSPANHLFLTFLRGFAFIANEKNVMVSNNLLFCGISRTTQILQPINLETQG